MPELPDVETYRRYFGSKALRQTIGRVHIGAPQLLSGVSSRALQRALARRKFKATRRHGKYLFAGLDSGRWLALHFGMTGRLAYFKHEADRPRYTQFLVQFGNGSDLAYIAPRKLGRIALTDDPQTFVEERRLGPDALALDKGALRALAAKRSGSVKAWLMDQSAIAGIGNIYGDEILFQSRLDPGRIPSRLTAAEITRLYGRMRHVLERAIAVQADPARMPESWLIHHRRKGASCPRCGGQLSHARIAGRTTWYCPQCQR